MLVVIGLAGAAIWHQPILPVHTVSGGAPHASTPTPTPAYCNANPIESGHGGGWIMELLAPSALSKTGPTLTVNIWLENVSGQTQVLNVNSQVQLHEGFTTTLFPQQTTIAPATMKAGVGQCFTLTFGLPADGGGGSASCPFLQGDLLFYANTSQPANFGIWPSWPCS